ncbi:hypothetical protein MNEG_11168 [Monoraphidium neglectum]|uniref:Uncharacterized protein n=1 Tax=Monoraphidium neglectum TaxID=145388 RepID=A0A0D2LZH6_9CHLO|nr:hypothetical protein MNEG_11168 [Monoraphidium neglectum]KIY96794.1 hypothetical protein MNEG_11168 [Monoraphidium neglectum]|eukprot:XP_013895814.1 hypothetical protein MNEG_11168 [Monoraphidium neglectum]
MVEVVAAAQCVAAQAVAWDPVPLEAQGAGMRGANGVNGSSGDGSSGDGSSDDGSTSSSELIVDLLVICPVTAPNDSPVGVALLFDSWRFPSDGALGRPGFPRVQPAQLPDEGSLQAAADGVRQQADHVRALKQQQGLGNQHPDVQAAVAELQRRKERLSLLESLAAAFLEPRESPLDLWLQPLGPGPV